MPERLDLKNLASDRLSPQHENGCKIDGAGMARVYYAVASHLAVGIL